MEFTVLCHKLPSIKHRHIPALKVNPHGHHLVEEEPVSSGDSLVFPGTAASPCGSLFKKSSECSDQYKNHIHLILTLFSFFVDRLVMDFFISEISCQARLLSFPYKVFKKLQNGEKKRKKQNPKTKTSMLSVIHAK